MKSMHDLARNTAIGRIQDELAELFDEYAEPARKLENALVTARFKITRIQKSLKEYYESRPKTWRESAEGMAFRDWMNAWTMGVTFEADAIPSMESTQLLVKEIRELPLAPEPPNLEREKYIKGR